MSVDAEYRTDRHPIEASISFTRSRLKVGSEGIGWAVLESLCRRKKANITAINTAIKRMVTMAPPPQSRYRQMMLVMALVVPSSSVAVAVIVGEPAAENLCVTCDGFMIEQLACRRPVDRPFS